jgi:Glycosyl hydrolases family 31
MAPTSQQDSHDVHARVNAVTHDEILDRIRFRGDPVADRAATVVVGKARFTMLTPRLVRLEWAPDARFEDRASYAFPFRRGAPPAFTAATADAVTTIDTGALVVTFTDDGRPFHAGNLAIRLTGAVAAEWVPGQLDPDNLGGARRTVDDRRGDAVLEPGLVSRSGWAVVDDSATAAFNGDGWPVGRDEPDALDWYFFGYGHDFAAAVGDYTRFGGRVPLLPRWALGAWWSRYHAYDEAELKELVEGFAQHGLPLDVVVIDIDWHLPDGWTGYTWNRDLFPDPRAMLAWLHARGLRVTLNLHPAQGVQRFESAYPEFARRSGIDPASGEPVPFAITNRQFVRDYFELLHHPLEDEGVDFWWMDWQQGRATDVPGLDPLPWLNHIHFADQGRRPERRPIDFSRWGGLGSHRYPVGFSGDSFALWTALAFQPRYTAAGANVAYGWWSHDIGGHSGPDDPELYVRWVQFGAVSPILRLHSNKEPESERRPWAFDDAILELARDAFRLRYELVPYLYTAAREMADTGAAIVRPTAWAAPEEDGAYLARSQYLLGSDLLVVPVVRPADPETGLAAVDVWLPEGPWIDRETGETFEGPRWATVAASLRRIPQFVRPGSALPLAVGATSSVAPDLLTLSVFPGTGTARVYDDDAEATWTEVAVTSSDPSRVTVRVRPGRVRDLVVRVEQVNRPFDVQVNGDEVDDWWFADATLHVPARLDGQPVTVEVVADGPLSRLGPAHNAQVRAADLARLVPAGARLDALPVDGQARALAVARSGGPSIQVIEHTAPDEAVHTLGRVIVAAPETGTATATVRWTIERGSFREQMEGKPAVVDGQALVVDAPFAWDGSRQACQWRVEVRVAWEGLDVVRNHTSATLNSAITSWLVAAEPERPEPGQWTVHRLEPDDVDFGNLVDRFIARFRSWGRQAPPDALGWARTTVTVPDAREVAIAYVTGGPARFWVDAQAVEADVTGHEPVKYFTLDPPPRRTAPFWLSAGSHEVVVACDQPASGIINWYLTAWVTGPDGSPMLDVTQHVDLDVIPGP